MYYKLEFLLGDLDGEEPDLVYSARQKLAGLSSCFAQLTHKAQTIFQNSAKTEVSRKRQFHFSKYIIALLWVNYQLLYCRYQGQQNPLHLLLV